MQGTALAAEMQYGVLSVNLLCTRWAQYVAVSVCDRRPGLVRSCLCLVFAASCLALPGIAAGIYILSDCVHSSNC